MVCYPLMRIPWLVRLGPVVVELVPARPALNVQNTHQVWGKVELNRLPTLRSHLRRVDYMDDHMALTFSEPSRRMDQGE